MWGKVFALLGGGVWADSDLEVVGSVWYNFYQEQNNISARRGSSG